jgi:hypothetical protein
VTGLVWRLRLLTAIGPIRPGVAPADTPDSIDVGPIPEQPQAHAPSDSGIRVGVTVVYRPPGEQRAYPCRVEKIEGGRAYLVPFLRPWTSWVPVRDLTPVSPEEGSAHSRDKRHDQHKGCNDPPVVYTALSGWYDPCRRPKSMHLRQA